MTSDAAVALAVRYGLVMLFLPFSALDKVLGFDGAVRQAQEVFSARRLAAALIVTGLVVEVVMPLGILSGLADRLAAFVMAGYCATTAVLFKRFWQPGDFWAVGESKARLVFWDFLKNLSLGAGFLLITVGIDGAGWHAFLSHPFSSTHPYAPH